MLLGNTDSYEKTLTKARINRFFRLDNLKFNHQSFIMRLTLYSINSEFHMFLLTTVCGLSTRHQIEK